MQEKNDFTLETRQKRAPLSSMTELSYVTTEFKHYIAWSVTTEQWVLNNDNG